jgi:hypothetical protein
MIQSTPLLRKIYYINVPFNIILLSVRMLAKLYLLCTHLNKIHSYCFLPSCTLNITTLSASAHINPSYCHKRFLQELVHNPHCAHAR